MTGTDRRRPEGVRAPSKPTWTTSSTTVTPAPGSAQAEQRRRLKWPAVLDEARLIVDSYSDTSVTLRQLFYRLVAAGTIPNTQTAYKTLSDRTADARRRGGFPDLLDRTSRIEQYKSFVGAGDAQSWLVRAYRRDRIEGQPWSVVLGVEKDGMSAQLDAWFTDPLGIPHIALGGFASQTLADAVRRHVRAQDRPSVLIYAGDHDPSGEDIDRDLVDRAGPFDKVVRVALNADQLVEFDIPQNLLDPAVNAKLQRDSRAKTFVRRHGYLDQYEVDALPPETLRRLYADAIEPFWDTSAFDAIMAREAAERAELAALENGLRS